MTFFIAHSPNESRILGDARGSVHRRPVFVDLRFVYHSDSHPRRPNIRRPTSCGASLLVGPVFTRELSILPRRGRLFVARGAYVGGLAALWITAWQVLAGTQIVRNVGDFAYFGSTVFQVLAPLHLTAAAFFAALSTAAAVAHEKDRRTFDLLAADQSHQPRTCARRALCFALRRRATSPLPPLPLFALSALCGGVDFRQIVAVFVVTLAGVVDGGQSRFDRRLVARTHVSNAGDDGPRPRRVDRALGSGRSRTIRDTVVAEAMHTLGRPPRALGMRHSVVRDRLTTCDCP